MMVTIPAVSAFRQFLTVGAERPCPILVGYRRRCPVLRMPPGRRGSAADRQRLKEFRTRLNFRILV